MVKELITYESGLQVGIRSWGSENTTTLLFLHGLGSSAASFAEIATLLSERYRILAVDLPGHGESTFTQGEKFFSVESLAMWVLSVLAECNTKDVHVVGHSIGGNIGLAIAKMQPIKSLILLDGGYIRSCSIPGNSLEKEVQMAEQHCESYVFDSWKQFETELIDGGLSQSLVELAKLSMKDENNQVKLKLASDIAGNYVRQHFYEPSDATLTDVDAPVLLLRSTLPKEFNALREKEAARLSHFVSLTVEKVEDTTHDIYWGRPDVLASQIIQWIEK
ncbi:alpha/beta hydrolase [Planococcus halotolerans]|uniref:alpha/beta hydrolase n=1 Tax=Planococcus halotolerans TaxID=2233542 RepID=UPI001092C6E6|nr:alpha/beta hydrolase [Planococcus halotolerans]QHJ70948.1 alpha/beta fold hydrolase [Planococcus halotolerans]